ncbi:MAG TPA: hypothetical protein VFH96_05990 [Pyrinomonadaceae bacterium]|nr:hypothetical protein [Pyrinomonadaceae bacterium]
MNERSSEFIFCAFCAFCGLSAFVPFCGIKLWQRFDKEIESEPEAPTVVVKGDWKDQRHHKQQHQHVLVVSTDNQQEEEADDQNHDLGGNDVCENRAHKETVLTLEKRHAAWAVMADVERVGDYPGRTTRRTT